MRMITQIKNEDVLKPFLTDKCEDAGICSTIDNSISDDDIAIVKVDDYYHSVGLEIIPPAADFLVSVDCLRDRYVLYIIELKNIGSPSSFEVKNVYGKFKTTVEDFMNIRFAHIYANKKYKIFDLLIYFIADPYRLSRLGINYDEYKARRLARGKTDSTRVDNLLAQKPLKFREKVYIIKYDLPPNPIIKKLAV